MRAPAWSRGGRESTRRAGCGASVPSSRVGRMEDDIARSFVDFDRYDARHAATRLKRIRLALAACTLVGTGLALGLLLDRSRAGLAPL
jgi:hypothetical protein